MKDETSELTCTSHAVPPASGFRISSVHLRLGGEVGSRALTRLPLSRLDLFQETQVQKICLPPILKIPRMCFAMLKTAGRHNARPSPLESSKLVAMVAWRRFWVTVVSLWAYDVYTCGPDGAEKREYACPSSRKQNPRGPEHAKNTKGCPGRSGFVVTLGSFIGHNE